MKKPLVVIILFLVFAGAAFGYWTTGNGAVDKNNHSQKIFVINKGETVREIGNNLKREDLIRDPVVFFMYIKMKGKDKNVQAGDYRLSPSMSLSQLVEALNHGTLDIWVTLPEGLRAEEIADILKKDLPTYKESWRSELVANEGYLFPDTYLIPRDADVATVISMMRNNFDNKISAAGLATNSSKLASVVTIASLIEREAITDGEKPVISGILANRLSLGMALQVDATVQYAKGFNRSKNKWWTPITVDDYKGVVSPYNTYLQVGLPPGPISNPGIEAIKAAANPQDNSYLYYIHANGKIYPAKTVQEHNANVHKYL